MPTATFEVINGLVVEVEPELFPDEQDKIINKPLYQALEYVKRHGGWTVQGETPTRFKDGEVYTVIVHHD